MLGTLAKFLFSFAVITISSSYATSQELIPLNNWLELPNDAKEPTYPLVRCAAYYQATTNYIGTNNMSKEAAKSSLQTQTLLIFTATQARAKKTGGAAQDYTEQVIGDMDRISAMYAARMKNNYASSGQAFGKDTLHISDGQFCKWLTETLSKK